MCAMNQELWLRQFFPAPEASVRVVLLPHSGGSATFYLPIARALAPVADVYAVQYPGRQDRRDEEPLRDLRTLAGLVAEVLKPGLDRPLVLFGHSMGATLAFELAQRIPVAHLIVSGVRAPSHPLTDTVRLTSDDDLLAAVGALGGTNADVMADDELRALILPPLRADYVAAETYRWRSGPPLDTPITVCIGDSDPKTTVEQARAWAGHTTAPTTVEVFSGGHFYLVEHQEQVAETVARGVRLVTPGGHVSEEPDHAVNQRRS
ncbi:alpha/beta fold hydrolase [Streptomyces sp. SID5473]|uniref:FkbQ n=4 Tax=Streptomyces TaxID=1883 RepID=K7RZA8_9ACTN|nr:thioesterase [Streptomyces sp. KCTC 11604BP]AFV94639.1 FkbQ [Streptomyces tsukubensis]MYS65474.1 alpha/beta fold hydrolase [Streptomyces sp. SID5473]QKM71069.1 thioesterase [Streptomyces tsukubensis NRRL18488]TAI41676.1 FkbQ [Streptomyces tsukubensis]